MQGETGEVNGQEYKQCMYPCPGTSSASPGPSCLSCMEDQVESIERLKVEHEYLTSLLERLELGFGAGLDDENEVEMPENDMEFGFVDEYLEHTILDNGQMLGDWDAEKVMGMVNDDMNKTISECL